MAKLLGRFLRPLRGAALGAPTFRPLALCRAPFPSPMRQPVRFASQDGTDKKRVKAAVIHGDHQWLETYFQKNPAHLNTLMLQIGVADRSALCLQIATDHRDLATVELLLRLGANPLANPGPHISAFADACASRDVPMILLYLRMGANYLQPQSTTSASVLQECVERGWVAALVILLDHAKAHGTLKDILLHQLDQHGDNLLALACYKQKNLVALTLWIYAQQAGILKPVLTATTSQTERLPLHFAARDDDFHDLVALMLNEMRHSPVGTAIDKPDTNGSKPFSLAIKSGSLHNADLISTAIERSPK